jgi:predicted transcriptional regulator
MKRNSVMGESRKLITPEIRRSVDLSIYVADRIFDILEKQHKTQRDLANTLGKSEAEISKWMQGTHNFTLNTIAKIESVLGEHIFETSDK